MTNEFFRLKTEELLNEISQVKTFIKKHNPTIGILTEEILRKFLSTYLPKGVAVEQGFIIDENGKISRQIDLIIYDNLLYAPLYRINDIVVLPNKSVLEVIEGWIQLINANTYLLFNICKNTSFGLKN